MSEIASDVAAPAVCRGRFISFEGIDGAGKTTQIASLCERIRAAGYDVVLTREPGGTPLGEKIRGMLLGDEMTLEAETLLFFAARAEHVAKTIRPALERGAWVISDRFADATYAYQVGGKGLAEEKARSIEDWTLSGFAPDLTVLFDLSPECAAARRGARGAAADRFEREGLDFFSRVRRRYLERASAAPERFLVVDASLAPEAIAAQIAERVSSWL
nr:dTMP kinase [Sutterella massiliensis]